MEVLQEAHGWMQGVRERRLPPAKLFQNLTIVRAFESRTCCKLSGKLHLPTFEIESCGSEIWRVRSQLYERRYLEVKFHFKRRRYLQIAAILNI